MQKTILVPTDFCVASLNTLRLALEQVPDDQAVHVVLMYAESLDDSITELLFYAPKKKLEALKSNAFEEALAILKNRFDQRIASVRFELFHGYTRSAMRGFVEANQVDAVFIPQAYRLKPAKRGFDPIPLLKKSKITLQEVEWEDRSASFEENQLQLLFNN